LDGCVFTPPEFDPGAVTWMRLHDTDGTALALAVTGYQFPDEPDPGRRFSWHMVAGQATVGTARWDFHTPAMTCDEPPTLSAWLRAAADWLDALSEGGEPIPLPPEALYFVEPNLEFSLHPDDRGDVLVLEVTLDHECQRPEDRTVARTPEFPPGSTALQKLQMLRHGPPDILRFTVPSAELRTAADEWDASWAPYPDRPA
jgi:hypothetical protein